jgi:hemoglobin/transferrin/lactoferrin receptor protein
VELGQGYRFLPRWTTFTNFTWMDGEVDGYPTSAVVKVKEPVSRLMPVTADMGLRWSGEEDRYWIEGVLTLAGKQDDLSASDEADTQRIPPGGTPGYQVVTLRSGWRVNEGLNLAAAVENIFNEDYRIHGSGQNEPGTNFVFSASWRF